MSELVTNAVRHTQANTPVMALRLEVEGGWLRIGVHDRNLGEPEPRTPADDDESGFGLVLVDALADKWGVRPSATGKAVWAEFNIRH